MKLPGIILLKDKRFYFGRAQLNNKGWIISTHDTTDISVLSTSLIAAPNLSLIDAIDLFLKYIGERPPLFYPIYLGEGDIYKNSIHNKSFK